MIILDTCALIFDALSPDRLSNAAKKAISHAEKENNLFCCEISLWEIAMLIQKKRLEPGTDIQNFLSLMLDARKIEPIGITVEIASLSVTSSTFKHFDPADRLIAATTIYHKAKLVTCDKHLQNVSDLSVIWE